MRDLRRKQKRLAIREQSEEIMDFKELALSCGAKPMMLSNGVSLDEQSFIRFVAEIRRHQRQIDASLAYNFPFSPVIGHEIAKLIRAFNDNLLAES